MASSDVHSSHALPQEAALYVREGEDNHKFPYHPRGKWSRHAYTVLHHPAYYITHLIVGILLMLLALIEQPSVADKHLSEDQPRHFIIVSACVSFLAPVCMCMHGIYNCSN